MDQVFDRFAAIRILVAISEYRSFTKAAKHLGITPSGVSKGLQRLENRLGVRLVWRTTRSVMLTAEGTTYAEKCRQILASLEDVTEAVADSGASLSGKLRIQLPAAFGRNVVLPAMAGFLDSNPRLMVEIELTGRTFGLTEESIDVAVFVGQPQDSGMAAKKLCDLDFVLCASPEYLRKHGRPNTLEDLHGHRCLAYVNPVTGRRDEWVFQRNGETSHEHVNIIPMMTANGIQALIDAAIVGVGVVYCERIPVVEKALVSGELVEVLEAYRPLSRPVYALYKAGRYLPGRVRAFLNLLDSLFQVRE